MRHTTTFENHLTLAYIQDENAVVAISDSSKAKNLNIEKFIMTTARFYGIGVDIRSRQLFRCFCIFELILSSKVETRDNSLASDRTLV